ncbi:inositol monophosphatase family protein [Halosimplex halophilum]|uniref:inositol monophosphatase family protein n=1 Tax=Halosimplex halophilum TaxID=2559572 RepID=UPI00107F996C|nr:inositol monophosphatase family protein [Halosimplex halophilum]
MPDDSAGADAGADSAGTPRFGAADDVDADALADTARRAVEAGGDYLREAFANGGTPADYTAKDVKAEADREAERRVLDAITDAHPDHRISAEESGDHDGDGAYRWVVDALDGTNNFAAGIPTFGVAATACDRAGPDGPENRPVATAVHVPVLDDTYVATRGGGVEYNGTPVEVTDGTTLPPEKATVGMIIGPEVVSGGAERREWDAVTDAVEEVPKRAIQTWAPVVYWGLLARGKLEGFVCYYPAEREQVAGSLLAGEAGAVARSEGPLTVFGADREIRDALFDAATSALSE